MILVDAHVHLHPCFDPRVFIEAAYVNFQHAAQQIGGSKAFVGVLCFTDRNRGEGYERLLGLREQQPAGSTTGLGSWSFRSTQEPFSMVLSPGEAGALVVIAGRQLVTREKLEVLAIGTRCSFEEDRPLRETIRDVVQAGAVPVIPWGVGKWVGKRGRIVREMLVDSTHLSFFLGDNANRLAGWRTPYLFRVAAEHGYSLLPGSDPLPFPAEMHRAGSFGFSLAGSLDLEKPAQDLKQRLSASSVQVRPYGSKERPFRFVKNQLAMQVRNVF